MSGFGRKLWARVVVEGWPEVFVSDQSMAKTLPDGREQINGLQVKGISLGVDVSLPNATIESEGFRVRLADLKKQVTASLGTIPTSICSLVSDADVTDTSITVDSTADFGASGVIHLGTETIAYSGKTATTFTGLTRGHWGTIAQKHVVPGGEGRYYPQVTNIPQGLKGRRVYLYLYTDEPTATAAGNPDPTDADIFWRGIAGTDRRYDGGEWSFQVKPLTSILDQEIGSDLDASVPIRGIYYPFASPFVLMLARKQGASETNTFSSTDRFDQFFEATATAARRAMAVVGFFETTGDFLAELQTQLDDRTVGVWDSMNWGTTGELLTWQEEPGGYRLVYRTGSTPYYIQIMNPFAASEMDRGVEVGSRYWLDEDGAPVTTMAADTTYHIRFLADYPRALYGRTNPDRNLARLCADPADAADNPADRIYLGGDVVPTTNMIPELESGELDALEEGATLRENAYLVSTADRWIQVRTPRVLFRQLVQFGPATRFRFGRLLGTGTVEDFRSALMTNGPLIHTSGGSPLLSADDIPSWATEVNAAAGDLLLGSSRVYVTREGMTLADILAEEWKLIGVHPTLDSQGRLVVKRLRLAAATDSATATLTARNTFGKPPVLERNGYGTLGKVVFRTGYNAAEDEHQGRTYVARNLRALSLNPQAGALEIAPLSESSYVTADGEEMEPRDAVEAASRVLGIFGAPYDLVTFVCSWGLSTVRPGDTVSITSSLLPNTAGGLGVSTIPALVEGVKLKPWEGRVELRCLVTLQRLGGYAPSYRIASSAVVSGFQYDLTTDYAAYTDSTPGNELAVGDAIEVRQRNTRTPTRQTGTVDAVTSGSGVVRVTLAGAIPSGDLSLEYDEAANVQESQEIYVFIGGSDRRVDFASGTVRAKDYAP